MSISSKYKLYSGLFMEINERERNKEKFSFPDRLLSPETAMASLWTCFTDTELEYSFLEFCNLSLSSITEARNRDGAKAIAAVLLEFLWGRLSTGRYSDNFEITL